MNEIRLESDNMACVCVLCSGCFADHYEDSRSCNKSVIG
jgi:hypothetical protein